MPALVCVRVSACAFCVCLSALCVRALWFTAPLNPIQSKARAAMESEQRVDVH